MKRDAGTGHGDAASLGLLRALPDGAAHVGPDGIVRFLNPAGERILGLAPGEWSGRNLLEILQFHGGEGRTHPLDLDTVFDHLATGRAWRREAAWLVRASDGQSLPAAYAFAPVAVEGGVDGAVLLFRDETDRHRAERAMHEARVGLATAGEVQAAKSAFLANVSRDLMAPVDALVAAADRLVTSDLPPGLVAEAETVRTSARGVVSALTDLVDWSRLEAGTLTLQPIDFDLRAALGEVVDALRPAATAKGLSVELRVEAADVDHVVADPGRVRQIAARFLSHAIRVTPAGAIVVSLETTWRARTDLTLRLAVTHGGPAVTDVAATADGATTPAAPTDPRRGLAFACRLVERMDGAVGGENLGDGTSSSWFELRLPIGRPRSRDLRAADLRGVRALVVDSSDAGRERLVQQLTSAGLRCAATGSGGQALRLLRSAVEEWDPYRLAVLSAPMREMDAATLGDLVKGDPRLRDTALIYLASVGESGDAQRLASIGFVAYLMKPVQPDVLRSVLGIVWGAALLHADIPLLTRHTLRDSRVLRLTPDEIRDRKPRAARPEDVAPVSTTTRGAE